MVICVALYQGLQIFAGRFGGKCLDQCKHCRPRRNPTGSKDHSRSLLLSSLQGNPLNLCQAGWAHWRGLCGSKSAKGSRFHSHQFQFFHKYERYGPGSLWQVSHWPSLGSGFSSLKSRWWSQKSRWWSLSSFSLILPVYSIPLGCNHWIGLAVEDRKKNKIRSLISRKFEWMFNLFQYFSASSSPLEAHDQSIHRHIVNHYVMMHNEIILSLSKLCDHPEFLYRWPHIQKANLQINIPTAAVTFMCNSHHRSNTHFVPSSLTDALKMFSLEFSWQPCKVASIISALHTREWRLREVKKRVQHPVYSKRL